MGPLVHIPLGCLTAQVYKIAWWMGHYNAKSPKRHLGLTNNVWTDKLNKGVLSKAARKRFSLKTVNRTISKSGKMGYQGNSNLKKTQILVYDFMYVLYIYVFLYFGPPSINAHRMGLHVYKFIRFHPREYPQRFGVEVCKLLPKLKSEGEGKISPNELPTAPAHELLRDAEWLDWPEANLKEVVRYLYGNKSLRLPAQWKEAFPKSI